MIQAQDNDSLLVSIPLFFKNKYYPKGTYLKKIDLSGKNILKKTILG